MSSKEEKLIVAKTKLMAALGNNTASYLSNLKQWFMHKMSWEEFDIECRKLLIADTITLHNQFMRALLNKVDTFTPISQQHSTGSDHSTSGLLTSKNSRKRKRSSRPISDRATFDPADIYDYIPDECSELRPPASSSGSPPPLPQQRYSAQELLLPDAGLVMGRFLVGAWETGLVNVEDNAAEFIVTAVQVILNSICTVQILETIFIFSSFQLLLKNIISSIFLRKKHYRVTSGGRYFFDVGYPLKDPFTRNTVTRQPIDDTPIEIDKAITSMSINRPIYNDDSTFISACENIEPMLKRRITVQDVFNIMHDKNIIPSHSVHSINFEKISQSRQ